jgi:hypothetical protein
VSSGVYSKVSSRMSYEGVLQYCPPGGSQGYPPEVSSGGGGEGCLPDCPPGVSSKGVLKGFLQGVIPGVLQSFPGYVVARLAKATG